LRYEIFPTESFQTQKELCLHLAAVSVCHSKILPEVVNALKKRNSKNLLALTYTQGGKTIKNSVKLPYLEEIFDLYFSVLDREAAFHLLVYLLSPAFQTRDVDHFQWFQNMFQSLGQDGKLAFLRGLGPIEIPVI